MLIIDHSYSNKSLTANDVINKITHPTRNQFHEFKILLIDTSISAMEVSADNSTLDAAIGAAIGGAAGAALGNELGGRSGAIVGGALGVSAGTAITIEPDHHQHDNYPRHAYPIYLGKIYPENIRPGYYCPPGQAKKDVVD